MNRRETAAQIEEEAARWAIRSDDEAFNSVAREILDKWIAGDDRRRGAFLRARGALAFLSRGRALADLETFDQGPRRIRDYGRHFFLAGAATAAVAAAVLMPVGTPSPQEFETDLGGISRLTLADGSTATLNTLSAAEVSITSKKRDIELKEGEAWFQVDHDPRRPFTVKVGTVRVQAVGTAFSVRRRSGGTDILVSEGRVKTWVVGREDGAVQIKAGFRAFLAEGKLAADMVVAPADVEQELAWRTGTIALDGETVGQAIAEMNRYNHTKLVVSDARLADQKVVGYFRTNEPERFAKAVSQAFGARLVTRDDELILTSRQ